MQLAYLNLKHFRTFNAYALELTAPRILIVGANGSGKSSLLEAMYYAGTMRSFRTHLPRELVQFGQEGFFIGLTYTQENDQHELNVGVAGKKKLVKLDNTTISAYKQLHACYRPIVVTEEDLELIKGGPDVRRSFMDHACMTVDPSFWPTSRRYQTILENRNALLQHHAMNREMYELWTSRLWEQSAIIQQHRITLLARLEALTNELVQQYFGGRFTVSLTYKARAALLTSAQEFIAENQALAVQEQRMQRSLWGSHLDDCMILFGDQASRAYASRGQQKLLILLLKIAHMRSCLATENVQSNMVMLLDDFMGDFDYATLDILLQLFEQLPVQLVFTSPTQEGYFEQRLLGRGAQQIKLTV